MGPIATHLCGVRRKEEEEEEARRGDGLAFPLERETCSRNIFRIYFGISLRIIYKEISLFLGLFLEYYQNIREHRDDAIANVCIYICLYLVVDFERIGTSVPQSVEKKRTREKSIASHRGDKT